MYSGSGGGTVGTPSSPHFADGDGGDPYELLLSDIDGVIAEWRSLMQPEPWSKIPTVRLIDAFPHILPEMVRLAKLGAAQVNDDLKERIASDHGLVRREDEVPITALADEWNCLKRACSRVLQRSNVDRHRAADAMHRLDLLVDDAVGYTLRGYYRSELDTLRGRGLERRDGSGDRRTSQGDRRTDSPR